MPCHAWLGQKSTNDAPAANKMMKNKAKTQYVQAWSGKYDLPWDQIRALKGYLPWFDRTKVIGLYNDFPRIPEDWNELEHPEGSYKRTGLRHPKNWDAWDDWVMY